MESDQAPQLKGVVIITLPPSDNPSLGKTITAFTLSDSPPTPPHQAPREQQEQEQQQLALPIQSSPNHQFRFSLRKTLFGSPRIRLGLLGVSLLALISWVSISPNTLLESRNSDDDDQKPNSFVFPLYPKWGIQGDVELKLGRFVGMNRKNVVVPLDDGMGHKKITKLVSTESAAVDSTTIFPVRGNIYPDGLYYTYLLVGSPPKRYFLDMDTGSDLTWIQCDAPCTSCAKGANPLYKPTKEKIIPFKDSLCVEVQRHQKTGYCENCHQCDYEIEYADHSSSMGVLARDELHLMIANGSMIRKNVAFGCAYDQQGLLLNSMAKTDGILGLSRAKVSLPFQLASQGIIKNVVGHCLATDAASGGYMFLGDDIVPYWKMTWVPMLNSPSTNFYHSEVAKMSYGNRQLNLGSLGNSLGRVVFDSGSSYSYFMKQAYSDLVASLADVSGKGLIQDDSDPTLPICWRAKFPIRSVIDVKQFFKPLTLQLGSKWWIVSRKIRIPPEGYLIISNKGNVCLGILDGSKVHDGSSIILGDISLRGQLIVYDNVNHKIGWVHSDCVMPQRFESLPFL
ncbi:aspartyl protease APCB1 [Cornus florida]|uniref:aspartyl protease APCB1 n=1 Tax=Cornus florida TaxID=4283 RepID=UPI0028A16490|nr:aspartyl protease APCB1 [Cornus florida]